MPNVGMLRHRMEQMGMTQQHMAQDLRISSASICRKIRNLQPMSLEEAEQISELLEIHDDEFAAYFFTK